MRWLDTLLLPWGMMMVPTRRAGDEEPDWLNYVRPLALPAATVIATIGGVNLGPVQTVHEEVTRLTQAVQGAREELVRTQTELAGLKAQVTEISTRRNLQVAELEKRILACELTIAQEHSEKRK